MKTVSGNMATSFFRPATAQMTGLLGAALAVVADSRVRKARLESSRSLDDVVLRDIGVSRADLYGSKPPREPT